MEPIIVVDHVTKRYKEGTVLKDVTVSFEKGKIHGIIGKNGSGKSMLFKTICGFVRPDEGKVTVNGQVVGKDVDFPDDLGVIIEAPGFLPYYSGFKNLKLLADLRGRIGNRDIEQAMTLVGLDYRSKKSVRKYSMGMKQRLGIAQAVMENPSILILDEPMNGLDRQGIADVREILKKLRSQGKTILITSHNHEDIEQLCDTVCEMEAGELTIMQMV
ncbi:MAG: ATP-binding cassette domain-containing protein [Clostridia bacterium]|jgi:ABC-2 type transport system ATP-binding protein